MKQLLQFSEDIKNKICTIDMHTAGEPLRIIVEGLPKIKGNSIIEKQKYFKKNLDHIRSLIINEPRGHADMYAAVLTDPISINSCCGVFFLHNEGYSSMCGHAIIALAKFIIETRWIPLKEDQDMQIDVPAGQVIAKVRKMGNRIVSSSFINVPSFVFLRNHSLEIDPFGSVNIDIAYGGAFYALCDADKLGIPLKPASFHELIQTGQKIKNAINKSVEIHHPFKKELGFLYGTIFTGKPHDPSNFSRNVCIFANGEVDRSPTGTGVSARAAYHFYKGEMDREKEYTIESIIGTTMTVCIKDILNYGNYDAIIPEVSGNSYFTGKHEFWVESSDPLNEGFLLR